MITQDKKEEIQVNLAQLEREGEQYRGSGWGKKKMDRVFGFLEKFIDFETGSYQVLDLGCGGMTLGRELEKISSFDVVGVDLVFDLLDRLSRKRTPGIPLVAGDIEHLPFGNDSFDLIAHNQVLHHFLGRHIALSEIHRVLKPGGLLFSIETNGWNPYVYHWHHSPKSKKKNFIGDNENPFGVLKFKNEVKSAGLHVKDWKMINFDFIGALSPFDTFFGVIPLFNLIFGGSMVVCAQK